MPSYSYIPVSIPTYTNWKMWTYFSVALCVYVWQELFNKVSMTYHIPTSLSLWKCSRNSLTVEGKSLSANDIVKISSQVLFPASLPAFIIIARVRMLFSLLHQIGAHRPIAFPVFKTSSCSDFHSLLIMVFSKGEVLPVTQRYKATTNSVLHKTVS